MLRPSICVSDEAEETNWGPRPYGKPYARWLELNHGKVKSSWVSSTSFLQTSDPNQLGSHQYQVRVLRLPKKGLTPADGNDKGTPKEISR